MKSGKTVKAVKADKLLANRVNGDAELKTMLLEMDRRGEPRPKVNVELVRELKRLLTKPVE